MTPVVTKRNRCDDTCSCCSFFCCCCEETVVPRAAVVDKQAEGRMPDGFREVGYRVNLQGKWTKQSLAGEETHHLDIKAGDDSLNIGANVEMPVHYNVRAPPVARGSPLPVNMRASPDGNGLTAARHLPRVAPTTKLYDDGITSGWPLLTGTPLWYLRSLSNSPQAPGRQRKDLCQGGKRSGMYREH